MQSTTIFFFFLIFLISYFFPFFFSFYIFKKVLLYARYYIKHLTCRILFYIQYKKKVVSHRLIILPKLTAYMQQCQKSRPSGFLTIILCFLDSDCLITENLPVPLERASSEFCGWAFPLPLLSVHTVLANDPKRLCQFAMWVI